MTFKQQMEEAIKEYLTSMGFKYAPKQYLFYKDNENDLSFCTMYGTTSYHRKEYYELQTMFYIKCPEWDDEVARLFFEKEDLNLRFSGPLFFWTPRNIKEKSRVIFTGTRSMEENLAAYKHEFETYGLPLYEKFTTKDIMYENMFKPEYSYAFGWFSRWYFPVVSYLYGDYEKAMHYASQTLNELKKSKTGFLNTPSVSLVEYSRFYKNLLAAIKARPDYKEPTWIDRIKAKWK